MFACCSQPAILGTAASVCVPAAAAITPSLWRQNPLFGSKILGAAVVALTAADATELMGCSCCGLRPAFALVHVFACPS